MHKAIEGTFRNRQVELLAPPPETGEPPSRIDVAARGIGETEAAGLRARLGTFAQDWDRPEMDIYDDE